MIRLLTLICDRCPSSQTTWSLVRKSTLRVSWDASHFRNPYRTWQKLSTNELIRSFLVLGYLQSDFAGVIKALDDGSLQPAKMITSKIKIDRVVEDGYRALIEEKDKHVKILVDCRA
jgi:threonine dehydrogenase-like Zn-dependent dehydrogenase